MTTPTPSTISPKVSQVSTMSTPLSSSLDSQSYNLGRNQEYINLDLNATPEDTTDDFIVEDVVTDIDDETIINIVGENSIIANQEPELIENSTTVFKPNIGMEFDTLESSKSFYNRYARIAGFSIRIRSTKKDKLGVIATRHFSCSMEGFKSDTDNNISKKSSNKRCGCLAHMKIKFIKGLGKYQVFSFEEKHNHELQDKLSSMYLRSHRNIDGVQAGAIDITTAAGLGPKATHRYMSLEAGGSVNLGFTTEEIKSYLRTKRQKDLKLGEANSVLEYFQEKKGHAFGDVIMFDTTFGTNKESRPLGIFTGFNNHRQCVVFGGCLIFDETIPSFKWVFKTFLDCHDEKKPGMIFTDQDAAICNALEVVMNGVRHCLCSWHIFQNATKNLAKKLSGEFNSFLTGLKTCMFATYDVDKFEKMCEDLAQKYGVTEDTWFKKFYERKEQWSVAYRMNIFSAGVLSTQLAESTNARIKKELGSEITMKKFFHGFDVFLAEVRETERKIDCNSRQSFPYLYVKNAEILKHAAQVYTPSILSRFSEQFDKMHNVFLNDMNPIEGAHIRKATDDNCSFLVHYDPLAEKISCECCMFERCGYLCAHILRVFDVCRVRAIPDRYILIRWTRQARSGLANVNSNSPKLSDFENIAVVSSNFHRLIHRTRGQPIYVDRIMKFISEEHKFIDKNELIEASGNNLVNAHSSGLVEPMDARVTGLKKKNNSNSRKFRRQKSFLEKLHKPKGAKTKKASNQPQSEGISNQTDALDNDNLGQKI